MKKLTLIGTLFLLVASAHAENRVRRIAVQGDQIVAVKTAMGVATIIQVPDRPNSVVVGDQEAFKVEYLDQAITIKPLHGGAKSNLYIYTDWKRYNVQLITGAQSSADYVVYLESGQKSPVMEKSSLLWHEISRRLTNENLSLGVRRVGRTRDGVLLVEFSIRGIKSEPFKPEWIWLSQNHVIRPIQNLFLSSLQVQPRDPIQGVMRILQTDISDNEPLRIELRRKKKSFLTLPKVAAWKTSQNVPSKSD